jgi:hypothetical protein
VGGKPGPQSASSCEGKPMSRPGFRIPHSAFRTSPRSCLGNGQARFMGRDSHDQGGRCRRLRHGRLLAAICTRPASPKTRESSVISHQ